MTFERYANAGHVVMQPLETDKPAFESWSVQRYGLSRPLEVTTYSFTVDRLIQNGAPGQSTTAWRMAWSSLVR